MKFALTAGSITSYHVLCVITFPLPTLFNDIRRLRRHPSATVFCKYNTNLQDMSSAHIRILKHATTAMQTESDLNAAPLRRGKGKILISAPDVF